MRARQRDDAFQEEGHLLVGVQPQERRGGDAELDRKHFRRAHHGQQIGVGVREQHDGRIHLRRLRLPAAPARVLPRSGDPVWRGRVSQS